MGGNCECTEYEIWRYIDGLSRDGDDRDAVIQMDYVREYRGDSMVP